MTAIAMNSVCAALISGIEKAQCDYEQMSGGEWVWTAAEYLLTTYIAKAIYAVEGSKFVTVESNGIESINYANAKVPGPKPKKARLRGRFDLLLWWANATPRAIIEVKNQLSGPSQWFHDIERITSVLLMNKEKSTLEFGAFAYYYSELDGIKLSAEQKISNKFKKVEEYIKEHFSDKFIIQQTISEIHVAKNREDGCWAAACVIIKPR